jgi:hypothetical protein
LDFAHPEHLAELDVETGEDITIGQSQHLGEVVIRTMSGR